MPSDIVCDCVDGVDRIRIEGVLDEETSLRFANSISQLRQKGARCILWVGTGLRKIEPHASDCLIRPMSVFRQLGGRLAAASFSRDAMRGLERAYWRRHLNLFSDEEEALRFLKGPTTKTVIEPKIAPEPEPVEDSLDSVAPAAASETSPENDPKKNEVDLTQFVFDEEKIDESV